MFTLPPRETRVESPLHVAVTQGDVAVVEEMLAQGADIEGVSHVNETPLQTAARGYYNDMCALLLRRGALLAPETIEQLTEAAVHAFSEDLVEAMIERGMVAELVHKAAAYSWSNLEEYLATKVPRELVVIPHRRLLRVA